MSPTIFIANLINLELLCHNGVAVEDLLTVFGAWAGEVRLELSLKSLTVEDGTDLGEVAVRFDKVELVPGNTAHHLLGKLDPALILACSF